MADYDVAILGSGPGGYVAAIRAAQLGLKTAVVEREEVGGICLNWGCIPSKALLHNAELVSLLGHADDYGIVFDNLRLDYGKAVDRSRQVVQRMTRGIGYLFNKNKVTLLKGEGRLKDSQTIEVSSGETISASSIILATGARARSLPMLTIDGDRVLTSREALALKEVPSSVAIIGGGAIGCEFAYLYNTYGAKVTIVELLPHLLPNEDEEISQQLERAFGRQGIQYLTNTQVSDARVSADGVTLKAAGEGSGEQDLQVDRVLVAVGIQGNVEEIGLDEAGVQVERGIINVDENMRTSAPGVYAIGDVTGKLALAHVASAQGVMVVERLAGMDSPSLDYDLMPRATYCHPQVASFGLSEKQAVEQGHKTKVGKFPFTASGKAVAMGETEGMIKIVAEARGEILGAHLIGSQVTELLPELSMTKMLEGTSDELGFMVHAHPTLSEVVKEAALGVRGEAIHI